MDALSKEFQQNGALELFLLDSGRRMLHLEHALTKGLAAMWLCGIVDALSAALQA